jgi:hypothetical protein
METNRPKNINSKVKGRKIESFVIWYDALKQNDVKQTGVKQGLGVKFKLIVFCRSIPFVTVITSQSTRPQSWHFVPAGNTTLKSTGERSTYEFHAILDKILILQKFNFPYNTVSTECENQIHRLLLSICLSHKYIYVYIYIYNK